MDISITIEAKDDGRLLKYFVRSSVHISYHQFSMMKTENGMRVNGMPVHANHVLHAGDVLTLHIAEADASNRKTVVPEELPISVVYEDDDILIIDKPAPLPTQCSERNPGGTLENRFAARYPDIPFRPLNRLDKGTSGLLCAAKHAHACQLLQKQLHTDAFVREYIAVVEGALTGAGTIDLPIAKEDAATVRRVIDHVNGKRAVTHYSCVGSDGDRSIVRLRLETGRTHQIRVHLSSIGHPICGDFLYGTEIATLPGRFALHSASIRFVHPIRGILIEYASALPEELKSLCRI